MTTASSPSLPLPALVTWQNWPFEGELRVRSIEPPVIPEPPRQGEPGAPPCSRCAMPDSEFVWTDEHWRLTARHTGLPFVGMLEPRRHVDLDTLPLDLAAEFGVRIARVNRAVMALGGIARVHLYRWGDGGSHMHIFLYARPEGAMQLKGHVLGLWSEILPKYPEREFWANLHRVAATLAVDGGTAHL